MKPLFRHPFSLKLLCVLLVFVSLYGCQKSDQDIAPVAADAASLSKPPHPLKQGDESADVVYQWYRFMSVLQRNVSPQPAPFVAGRAYAYIGVGLFESVQPGIDGGSSFGPKLLEMPVMPKPDPSQAYLWRASANAALASLFKLFLTNLSPADKASIDANELAVYDQLSLTTSEEVMERSEAFGRSIASAIYDWSTTDNFSITSGTYVPLNEPWAWIPTPPANAPAAGDNLQYSRPFLKYSQTSVAPPMPVPYSEDPASAFFLEVQEAYDLGGSTTATAGNMATARWWADAGGVGVGVPAPYHFLSIITDVLESLQAGLWKAAEVYGKTGIAMKDGPINTFRSKYQYHLLRPITYIRRHIDPNWFSVLPNPPYPEYPSGLVGFYGPIVQVLINEFGDISVTDNTYAWRGDPPRQYSSLSQLRLEAALSRVYAGIHYRFTQLASIDIGVDLGNEIDKVRVVGPEYQ